MQVQTWVEILAPTQPRSPTQSIWGLGPPSLSTLLLARVALSPVTM
jgi:hypothetical protein